VAVTWLLVLIENALLALIPLFIGRAIDALLANESGALWEIAGVMLALVLVASARRAYDTRCYGTLRVTFGAEVVRRIGILHVSQVNARLDMSREMVDFLEEHVPGLLTAIVQMIVSILVLWAFDQRLGASSVSIVVVLVVIYALFHRRFYRLNSDLNTQREQQVSVLEQQNSISLLHHLKRLRIHEVRLSDSDVLLYAAIFKLYVRIYSYQSLGGINPSCRHRWLDFFSHKLFMGIGRILCCSASCSTAVVPLNGD
jgi:ABC-type multidrug transport system fused ATPase/permease subunit